MFLFWCYFGVIQSCVTLLYTYCICNIQFYVSMIYLCFRNWLEWINFVFFLITAVLRFYSIGWVGANIADLSTKYVPLASLVFASDFERYTTGKLEEGCVLLLRGLCATLKRVVCYFEDGGVVLCSTSIISVRIWFWTLDHWYIYISTFYNNTKHFFLFSSTQ